MITPPFPPWRNTRVRARLRWLYTVQILACLVRVAPSRQSDCERGHVRRSRLTNASLKECVFRAVGAFSAAARTRSSASVNHAPGKGSDKIAGSDSTTG